MSREMDGWMDKMVRGLPCSEKGQGKHKKIIKGWWAVERGAP